MATRCGLESASFARAAGTFSDSVGPPISTESLRRVTEQFGAQVEQQRVAPVAAVAAAGDDPAMALTERVAPVAPVAAPANISSDGAMVRLRGEGYKEVKLTAISSLSQAPVPATRRGYAPSAPEPRLSAHSYQAGLWDADEFAAHQYVEGLRRQVGQTATLTSVNDGAPWIRRVTATNFPTATLILDWHHAEERLQVVADYAFSNPATQREWCATTTEQLWQGQLQAVVTALDDLGLTADSAAPDLVRHSPGSFQNTADATDSPAYRALGLPLGSGTVESAANTLVHHRMRRQGPGWNRDAGHAMLAALSELHSDRFERAWADSQPALAP